MNGKQVSHVCHGKHLECRKNNCEKKNDIWFDDAVVYFCHDCHSHRKGHCAFSIIFSVSETTNQTNKESEILSKSLDSCVVH